MSRAELAEAAQSLPYGWVEDESNEDPSYDRNFLRQQIIPLLKDRWPAMARTTARTMALCAEQEALISELAEADWQAVGEGEGLRIDGLLSLSPCGATTCCATGSAARGRDALPRAAGPAVAGGGAGAR